MSEPVEIVNPRRKGWFWSLTRFVSFMIVGGGLLGGTAGAMGLLYFARDLPELPDLTAVPPSEVGTLYADNGQIMGRYAKTWKTPLPYEKIPRTLLLAFLATEDARFFSHKGIDFRGILRAAFENIRAGGVVQGGSTITQQLAKSVLTNEKTFSRKIREALLTQQIESRYSKEDILLLYLNRIYLGNGANGIQAASQHYFHKPVWELTLGQMALLAGLPQAPSRLDPTRNPDLALERRRVVLSRMVAKGFISQEQADSASQEDLLPKRRMRYRSKVAPFFAEAARKEIEGKYGKEWMKQGLEVHTTCNLHRNDLAQSSLQHGLEKMDRRQGWRGPLAENISSEQKEKIARRVRKFVGQRVEEGDTVIGVVEKVSKDHASVHIFADLTGSIHLRDSRWAGEYTEFPLLKTPDGRQVLNRSGRVSLDPRLKDLSNAIKPGDAVLLRAGKALETGTIRVRLMQLPKVEGAFIGADSVTGQVKALVGGYDFAKNQVNRVRSLRQTGSLMKPIIYSKAYSMGLAPSTLFSGAPFRDGKYNPTGDKASDDMIAWNALTKSNNAVSLRMLQYVLKRSPLSEYQAWGSALGLGRQLMGYTSEVLGTDQTLWDMTQAFARLARRGTKQEFSLIRLVKDGQGKLLERNLHPLDPANSVRETLDAIEDWSEKTEAVVVDPLAAYITAANLQEVTRRGTGKAAGKKLPFPTAGKTGTLPYDVWFVGWSPEFVAGVWVGQDTRKRVLGRSERKNKVYGGDVALPIWIDWMKDAHGPNTASTLLGTSPAGIEMRKVDPNTGLLALVDGLSIPHKKGSVSQPNPSPEPAEEITPPPTVEPSGPNPIPADAPLEALPTPAPAPTSEKAPAPSLAPTVSAPPLEPTTETKPETKPEPKPAPTNVPEPKETLDSILNP